MVDFLLGHFNYAVVIVLMMTGLYVVFASGNLIKRLAGLSVFQTSVFLLYITIGKVSGGQPPILVDDHSKDKAKDYASGHASDHSGDHASTMIDTATAVSAKADPAAVSETVVYGSSDVGQSAAEVLYSNPLPHVLILTAIVVGVATLAIGLALTVRIREVYGTIEREEIDGLDYKFNLEGTAD